MIQVGDIVVTKKEEEHYVPANTIGVVKEFYSRNKDWFKVTWLGPTWLGNDWYTTAENVDVVGHIDA